VPDSIYGEEVVCYIVSKDPALTEAAILQHCRQYLPPAKTPKQILFVPGLPRNERGKVLRDKLREDWIERTKLTA